MEQDSNPTSTRYELCGLGGLLKSCFSISPFFKMGIRLLASWVQLWRDQVRQCVTISGLEVNRGCHLSVRLPENFQNILPQWT